jgi:hypothetical protein
VYFVVLLPPGGEHQHRDGGNFFNLGGGGESVQFGHHHVHNNQVIGLGIFAAQLHSLHAVAGLGDLVALKLRVFADEAANLLLVVHY